MAIVGVTQGPGGPGAAEFARAQADVAREQAAVAREAAREQLRERIQERVQTQVERNLQRAVARGELTADQAGALAQSIAEQAAAQAAEQAAAQAAAATGRQFVFQRPGQPPTYVTTPNPRDMIPPQVVDITYGFFMTIIFCVVGFPIARAWARRMDRRGASPAASPEVSGQLRQLQQSVEAIAIEVERISEAQRFTTRVLTEGAAQPVGVPQGERVAAR